MSAAASVAGTPADALDLGPDLHAWMRPELFPDWSCRLLARALAHPCRRPSWLCLPAPPPTSITITITTHTQTLPPIMLTPAVFHMTGLVLQDPDTVLLWSECQRQNVSVSRVQRCRLPVYLEQTLQSICREESSTLWSKKRGSLECLALELTRCYVIMFPLLSPVELFSLFTQSVACSFFLFSFFFASHSIFTTDIR